jgi:hypothetical protein
MAATLKEYLRENPPGEFRSVPHYFPSGDYLTYFLTNERCHAKRLDGVVTVYLGSESGRLVGCKVKGVRHILKTAGAFGVGLDGGGGIRLGLFFFTGAAPDLAGREVSMKWYDQLKAIADVRVDLSAYAEGE